MFMLLARSPYWRVAIPFLVLIFLSGNLGCSGTRSQLREGKNRSYRSIAPSRPWKAFAKANVFMDADYAYVQPETGNALYLRSLCHHYKDASLNQLSWGFLRLFRKVKIEQQKSIRLSRREALSTVFLGELDGVKVKINAIVLKKHSCIFDFVYIGIPQNFAKDHPDFTKFVNNFSL